MNGSTRHQFDLISQQDNSGNSTPKNMADHQGGVVNELTNSPNGTPTIVVAKPFPHGEPSAPDNPSGHQDYLVAHQRKLRNGFPDIIVPENASRLSVVDEPTHLREKFLTEQKPEENVQKAVIPKLSGYEGQHLLNKVAWGLKSSSALPRPTGLHLKSVRMDTAKGHQYVETLSALSIPFISKYWQSVSDADSGDDYISDNGSSKKAYIGYAILPSKSEGQPRKLCSLHGSLSHQKQPPRYEFLRVCLSGCSREYEIQDPDAAQHISSFFYDGPFDMQSASISTKVTPYAAKEDDGSLTAGMIAYAIEEPSPREFVPHTPMLRNSGSKEELKLCSPAEYLKMTDTFRCTIEKGESMYDDELEVLLLYLELILINERPGKVPIEFDTIVYSRLDKLIQGLIDYRDKNQHMSEILQVVNRTAVQIQREWRRRFRAQLFTIDAARARHMMEDGRMANIIMSSSGEANTVLWTAQKHIPDIGPNAMIFHTGHWWCDLACAIRDGIVGEPTNDGQNTTKMAVITLLNGTEWFDHDSNSLLYELEGSKREMMTDLHKQTGKQIRILRGFRLKSANAPEAGIRYDGIYSLTGYSFKQTDVANSLFRLRLYYNGIEGESDIDKDYLTPSGRDDWHLFRKIERDEVKKRYSAEQYAAWQSEQVNEMKGRKEWLRQQKFREELRKYGV